METYTRNGTLVPPSHQSLVVRSLPTITAEERENILKEVEYNIFNFPAGLVTCDFLTDSGTAAMTDVQWAALLRGDESYGRNWGYYCLLDTFRDIFERGQDQKRIFQSVTMGTADKDYYQDTILIPHQGGFVNGGTHQLQRPNFFIVPQGRCAESLLFSAMHDMICKTAQGSQPSTVISNGFFDTTGANASVAGFSLKTFIQPGLNDPFPAELIGKENPFKGNLDIAAAEAFLADKNSGHVSMILLTVTNNWAAGQPVSMANIRGVAEVAKRNGIPLFFDACRFAENAFFIQQFESGFEGKSIPEIVREMFSHVDGFTISLKKDGLSNMGGVLCFRDGSLFSKQHEGIGLLIKERQILSYGNDTYGGMSGRDLMAATAGLYEVTKESYLRHRIFQVQSFAQKLQANGIAVLPPPGGHAIYLDMDDFFSGCDRREEDYASVGFTLELLHGFGIRSIEAGPFAWEWDKKSAEERLKIPNLVRFALPRHVFSDTHIDYTVAAIKELRQRRDAIPNVVITRGKDMRLRHFQAAMQPVPVRRINDTYVGEATRQLGKLCEAAGLDVTVEQRLLHGLAFSVGDWGHEAIPERLDPEARASDVSNDHSPIEYSVALDQRTGDAELRFLIEAEPQAASLARLQDGALRLNNRIKAEYGEKVSFRPFELIRGLFMPAQATGSFAAWHSLATSTSGEKWKIYLNPLASGKGGAASVIREALERLGLEKSWGLLSRTMSPGDYFIYFSLSLSPSPDDVEVKVYVAHPGVSAAEIAQRHAAVCPDSSTTAIERFCVAMAGGSSGPYTKKPLFSCFAFKVNGPERPTHSVYFPIEEYASNDDEAQERIEKYMDQVSVPPAYRQKYRRMVSAVRRRPLEAGRGIHSWVSLKQKPGADGRVSNAFYLSPEFFGPI